MYWVGRGCQGSGQMCVNAGGEKYLRLSPIELATIPSLPAARDAMMELEKLRDWIGQRETDIDYVTVHAVHWLSSEFH